MVWQAVQTVWNRSYDCIHTHAQTQSSGPYQMGQFTWFQTGIHSHRPSHWLNVCVCRDEMMEKFIPEAGPLIRVLGLALCHSHTCSDLTVWWVINQVAGCVTACYLSLTETSYMMGINIWTYYGKRSSSTIISLSLCQVSIAGQPAGVEAARVKIRVSFM